MRLGIHIPISVVEKAVRRLVAVTVGDDRLVLVNTNDDKTLARKGDLPHFPFYDRP